MAPKKIVIEDEIEPTPPEGEPTLSDSDPVEAAPVDDATSPADLESQLAAARAEADEYRDRLLRMAAELDNFKKRSTREMDDLRKFATENLIRQLLTVVDNLERAVESAPPKKADEQGIRDGVVLTLQEVMKILERHHVTPIEALGEAFDPVYHQAMSQEPSADQPPNTVVKEFQKGYLIHDRLLRPAMVVVSKAVDSEPATERKINTNA